jgi:ABC-type lipoprotein release transport system permease subunit
MPGIKNYSARYLASGLLEANYNERTNFNDKSEEVSAIMSGVDFKKESEVTGLDKFIVEGEYLNENDFDKVIVGAYLLEKYLPIESPGFLVLKNVEIGSKIKVKINGGDREMIVKGIAKSKVDEIDRRVIMLDSQLKSMVGRDDLNVSEITVITDDQHSPEWVKKALINSGFDRYAKIQTYIDAQPKFLVDIKNTFNLLGTIISSIGLIVAAITVFIVIFINAITRRKYIGIMKAIGVDGKILEMAYMFQSLVYATIGSLIGLFVVYLILVPYVNTHPINFPFSDGILVAPIGLTLLRIFILIFITALAGYLPARIIVQKNTLNSILGRN